MRSCDEILEWISADLDGELSAGEQLELCAHLEACPACSALYQELAGLSSGLAELSEPAPEGFVRSVMDRIHEDPEQERAAGAAPIPINTRTYWKKWAASAAAVAIVILGAVSLPGLLDRSVDAGGADSAPDALDVAASSAQAGDALTSAAPSGGEALQEKRDTLQANDSEAQAGGSDAVQTETGVAQFAATQADERDGGEPQSPLEPAGTETEYCGVLVITEEPLPEGLEAYGSTLNSVGEREYVVPADYYFSNLQILNQQAAANASDVSAEREDVDPESPYGLIIVAIPEK